MEQTVRPSLDQREALVGDVCVQYCAARRRTGDWFAVGNVVPPANAPERISLLVSGSGSTELRAIERMLSQAAKHSRAGMPAESLS